MISTIKSGAVLGLSLVATAWSLAASAVDDGKGTFELEPLTENSNGFIRDDGGAEPTDWSALFDVPDTEADNDFTNDLDSVRPTAKADLPDGVLRAAFFRDFTIGSTADTTSFTTGTKDIQNISGGGVASGEWQCKRVSNVSDKGDALNAYAAIYRHDNGDIMLAMGIERASENGTSKVGFWFLQDDDVACVATTGGSQTFTGNHMDGDMLVVIDFAQGGNNPTPLVFQWQGDATTGSLQPVTLVGTGACTVGTSNTCATTNQVQTLLHSNGGVPWLTQTKTNGPNFSHDLAPLTFFEAQVNMTDNNLQRCFTRFMANTRQSTSTSSTVFDYVVGDFDVCGFSATKSCSAASVTNGTDVNYNFKVNVTNTGIAPLHDVTVNEQLAGCSVVGTNGVTVAEGGSHEFSVSCLDVGLGAVNTAQVTANDDDGNPIDPATVTADVDDFGACALNVTSDIAMETDCDKVVLENTGSRLGLEATIAMTVKAPSSANSEALNNVQIDVYDEDCDSELISCTKLATIDVASQLKNGDADVDTTHTYDVGLGDNIAESECAASAIFRRRVVAHGTGAITGGTYWSSLWGPGTPGEGTPVALPIDCKPCIDCVDPAPQE
jgi:hypothetical protein